MAADPITSNTVNGLLNYDVSDEDDIFGDKPARDDKPTLSPRAQKRRLHDDKENFGLGLDEEVKITKKRRPIAKLDEQRLLSQAGLPKLRALAQSGQFSKKLRLKGSGHEFSDAGKLLNYYQLWLDNLYPRAKFADGLQMVEKVGHSKRMHVMRKEWIDEGKPGYMREKEARKAVRQQEEDADVFGGEEMNIAASTTRETQQEQTTATTSSLFGNGLQDDDLFIPDGTSNHASKDDDNIPEDDELDTLIAAHATSKPSISRPEPESEGEDDLDALLAEQDNSCSKSTLRNQSTAATSDKRTSQQIKSTNDGEEDEDDLDALLAEHETSQTKTVPLPVTNVRKRQTIFDDSEDEEDDLDALVAAQSQSKTVDKNKSLDSTPGLPPPIDDAVSRKSISPTGLSPIQQSHEESHTTVTSPLRNLHQDSTVPSSSPDSRVDDQNVPSSPVDNSNSNNPMPLTKSPIKPKDNLQPNHPSKEEIEQEPSPIQSDKSKEPNAATGPTRPLDTQRHHFLSAEDEVVHQAPEIVDPDENSQDYVADLLDLDDMEVNFDEWE